MKHLIVSSALSRTPETQAYIEILKTIAAFCAIGIIAALIRASYGLDLSAGFF